MCRSVAQQGAGAALKLGQDFKLARLRHTALSLQRFFATFLEIHNLGSTKIASQACTPASVIFVTGICGCDAVSIMCV